MMAFKQLFCGLVLAGALLGSNLAYAGNVYYEEMELEHDLQLWNQLNLRKDVGPDKRVILYLEAQPRVGNLESAGYARDDFSTLILRPAVGYKLNKSVSLWQGYAWVPIFQPMSRQEHRLFQQLLIENKVKKLTIINRTRLEQRWLEGSPEASIRARHMLRVSYPLDKAEKWSLVGYDEFFVNLNDVRNGPKGGVDQNRAFLGVNRKFNRHLNAELGYMNNLVDRPSPMPNRLNHIILLTFNVTL